MKSTSMQELLSEVCNFIKELPKTPFPHINKEALGLQSQRFFIVKQQLIL
ncbi:hypothetical protein J2T18_003113 [Paenibacillus polymyxa]|nr:hypothetical protein [Paenibacillus polymyxa]